VGREGEGGQGRLDWPCLFMKREVNIHLLLNGALTMQNNSLLKRDLSFLSRPA